MTEYERFLTAYNLIKFYQLQQIGDSVILYHNTENINFIVKNTSKAYYKICYVTEIDVKFFTVRTVFELCDCIGKNTPNYKASFDYHKAFPRKGIDI